MSDSSERTTPGWDAIVIHPDDDVAVALTDLAPARDVRLRRAGATIVVKVQQAIPLGHKFALHPLSAGDVVRKHGEAIGVATQDVAAGGHVHVHNLASRRAQRTP